MNLYYSFLIYFCENKEFLRALIDFNSNYDNQEAYFIGFKNSDESNTIVNEVLGVQSDHLNCMCNLLLKEIICYLNRSNKGKVNWEFMLNKTNEL